MIYEIHLKGHVDLRWEANFPGFTIAHRLICDQQPITIMTGPICDSAALYGMISRLRDLGALLICIQPHQPGPCDCL